MGNLTGKLASVRTIDCNYVHPEVAAAYLMVEGKSAAFVENNTSHAVPRLLKELDEVGLTPEQVEYIIITHVHLDHAGGTSALVEACPNAQVLAHPRASRHVINPDRLVASARQVYGDRLFDELYGQIEPVAENRVRSMGDEESVKLGERELTFFHTRGHANHHFCIHDSHTNGIFTGDSFGIGYPGLQSGSRPFLYPSTTPTDFDPDEARKSIRKILDTGADHAYLTHFGSFEHMEEGGRQMLSGLNRMEEILDKASVLEAESEEAIKTFCEDNVREYFNASLAERGIQIAPERQKLLEMDLGINALGLAFTAGKRRRKSSQ